MSTVRSADAITRIFELSTAERYDLFLTEVTENAQVWTLKGEGGFVSFSDDEGLDYFPFWPASEFANTLANDDWSDCQPEPLPLAVFMERWLIGMADDDRLVAVFPALDGSCMVSDPLSLRDDLIAITQQLNLDLGAHNSKDAHTGQ
ncbi:DUF2750 domain-containing protein [Chromatium okenii]|uniref:DUF2750 domain-containing protein n=1 Tax=Chromatium okenii TaxID=61644 RepID=A0A2S7XPY1_9GAMM|nr:DUF2750 domain-containing protein [Chromatium okenii]PQJ95482.1 DUF2750 domain-containing protein [Chromatium okenii]